jgi:hypothetical protein
MLLRQDRDLQARTARPEEECVELRLLVPDWQWTALEGAACEQRLTIGQLLRRLIGNHLAERSPVTPG